ncbi:MAG TPA: hypothetical protein VIW07_03765 [Candidatus Udaeobacter sp.]|jgi:hypothetical protein
MKYTSLKILSAITIALGMLGTNLYAQGTDSRIGSIARERGEKGAIDATPLTKAEAQKKYPSKSGGYPLATRDAHDASGVVSSPYPPHDKYNCSKVNHGGLVLDVHAKQVFVYP